MPRPKYRRWNKRNDAIIVSIWNNAPDITAKMLGKFIGVSTGSILGRLDYLRKSGRRVKSRPRGRKAL